MGPRLISCSQLDGAIGYFECLTLRGHRLYRWSIFSGAKDYFGVLAYGVMDYIQSLPVFLVVKIRGYRKYQIWGQNLFQLEISTGKIFGEWRNFHQVDVEMGLYTTFDC